MEGWRTVIDESADPWWRSTGYRYFPFAAEVESSWWVLRFNAGFPEHDQYTIFVDGQAVADVTGDPESARPLIAGIAGLERQHSTVVTLEPETSRAVVGAVAPFVNYGSEANCVCVWCETDRDPFALDEEWLVSGLRLLARVVWSR